MQVIVLPTSSNESHSESDSFLVRRSLQGDHQSFQELYRRHHTRVRAILFQLCDASAIDDLVQDVFLRAWKGLPKFRQSAQFSTWLYRITWNVASDQRQAAARHRTQLQTLTTHAPTRQESPDVLHLHYQDLVQRGLQELSFEHRTVLVLHDLEEVPQKEIAEILTIPLGTVKSRLFHARAAMRKYLEREGIHL